MTQEQKLRKLQSKIGKFMGDDCYSYALIINGRAVYNGMAKAEASWRRQRYIESGKL